MDFLLQLGLWQQDRIMISRTQKYPCGPLYVDLKRRAKEMQVFSYAAVVFGSTPVLSKIITTGRAGGIHIQKRKDTPVGCLSSLEQGTGVDLKK